MLCLFSSTRGSPATWQFRYRISGKLPKASLYSVNFPAAVESTPTRGDPAASLASSSCASPTGRADLPIARTKVASRTPDDTMPCRRQCNLEVFPHSSRNHVPCAILAFRPRRSHWFSDEMSTTSDLGSKTMKTIKVGPRPSVLSARPRTRPGNVDLTRLETPSKTCPPVMSRSRLPSPGAQPFSNEPVPSHLLLRASGMVPDEPYDLLLARPAPRYATREAHGAPVAAMPRTGATNEPRRLRPRALLQACPECL